MGVQEDSAAREAYIAAFAAAMLSVERQQKAMGIEGKAYRELKREGLWDAEALSLSYVAIVGGFSSLSARLRKYILNLGALAKQEFEKNRTNDKENEIEA